MNNADFGKIIENVRKTLDIKLAATNIKINYLVSEPNQHTTKWFSENLLPTETKKVKVKMNKPIYLGLSMLEISKILMYEFWYVYIKPKYQYNAKLCHMDRDLSFILKLRIFIKILQMILKKDLIHKIMRSIDHQLYEKSKK